MYKVQYCHGCYGAWEYRIVDYTGAVVKAGISDRRNPWNMQLAERAARRICDAMNASDAMMLAAMQAKAQVAR